MKSINILVLTMAVSIYSLCAIADTEWYGIDRHYRKCVESEDGPAGHIKNHQILDVPYKAMDIEENGIVVNTTIQTPSLGQEVTFYRGEQRCKALL